MDDELFSAAYRISRELWPVPESRYQFPSRLIVLMSMWMAVRSKPQQWVCERRNLPRVNNKSNSSHLAKSQPATSANERDTKNEPPSNEASASHHPAKSASTTYPCMLQHTAISDESLRLSLL